jgi:hypothetical protein
MANCIKLSFNNPNDNAKWDSILNDDILKSYTSESIIHMIMGKINKKQKEKEKKEQEKNAKKVIK